MYFYLLRFIAGIHHSTLSLSSEATDCFSYWNDNEYKQEKKQIAELTTATMISKKKGKRTKQWQDLREGIISQRRWFCCTNYRVKIYSYLVSFFVSVQTLVNTNKRNLLRAVIPFLTLLSMVVAMEEEVVWDIPPTLWCLDDNCTKDNTTSTNQNTSWPCSPIHRL